MQIQLVFPIRLWSFQPKKRHKERFDPVADATSDSFCDQNLRKCFSVGRRLRCNRQKGAPRMQGFVKESGLLVLVGKVQLNWRVFELKATQLQTNLPGKVVEKQTFRSFTLRA